MTAIAVILNPVERGDTLAHLVKTAAYPQDLTQRCSIDALSIQSRISSRDRYAPAGLR
jgi:hypothetical protein